MPFSGGKVRIRNGILRFFFANLKVMQTMQPQQRRAILSAALNLMPGREPTLDTVEAAIWALAGPAADENRVGSLMDVIVAYSHARARHAAASWARHTGSELPSTTIDLAQSLSTRRALERLSAPPASRAATVLAAARQKKSESALARKPHLTVIEDSPQKPAATPSLREPSLRDFLAGIQQPADSQGEGTTHDVVADTAGEFFTCSKCKRGDLTPDDFYKARNTTRGFAYICKECHAKKNKEYRDRKRQKELAEAARAAEREMQVKPAATDDPLDGLLDYLASS